VFDCLEDDVGEYEELDDDFLFQANEGKPALEVVEVEEKPSANNDFHNKNVVIVKDEMEEKLKQIKKNLQNMK
jgi:hypothetical protein